MPEVWIAHVDLDAFFAACEQRDHPEYRGRPVVVGAQPGGRGVVAAASYEAREFGIHSAMPINEAYRRCPDAVWVKPDIAKYRAESRAVFGVLTDITPVVEKASIDEAYLDISGLEKVFGPPQTIGREIRRLIFERTQLTASVGIGPNRLIAKLASDECKPDGLLVVAPDAVRDFLAPLPIGKLRGVGRQTMKIMRHLGIETVADLRDANPRFLAKHLGRSAADSFRRQAIGDASVRVVPGRARKSISKERTFAEDQRSGDQLQNTLRALARGVARTARREGLAGRVIRLKVRYANFQTLTRQKSLPGPTQDERRIYEIAWQLFGQLDAKQRRIRLIGVGLSDWAEQDSAQPDLFGTAASDSPLLATIDRVTERFGKDKLTLGAPRGD